MAASSGWAATAGVYEGPGCDLGSMAGDHLLTWQGTVSDDPEAGDQDEDNVIGFNLSEALQPFEPHPQQGYHVKVSWDSVNAPGGEKHKVFWLQCSPAPHGGFTVQKQVVGTDPTPGPFSVQVTCNHAPADTVLTFPAIGGTQTIPVPMGTTCAVTEVDSHGATVTFSESPADSDPDDGKTQVTGDVPPVVTVLNTFAGSNTQELQPSSVGTAVAGETLTAPAAADTLPRTGGDPRGLASVGAWALGLGGLTLLASRRR
jgi:uncharacterized protein DUF5979